MERDNNNLDEWIVGLILGKRDIMIDRFTSIYVDRSIALSNEWRND